MMMSTVEKDHFNPKKNEFCEIKSSMKEIFFNLCSAYMFSLWGRSTCRLRQTRVEMHYTILRNSFIFLTVAAGSF